MAADACRRNIDLAINNFCARRKTNTDAACSLMHSWLKEASQRHRHARVTSAELHRVGV